MTALRRIPVRIAGEWQPVAYVGHVEWHGIATADEPITALALARTAAGMDWSRVGRLQVNQLAIKLAVQPNEADPSRFAARMWLSMQPIGPTDGTAWAKVQQVVHLNSTAPFAFSLNHMVSGEVAWFTHTRTVEGLRFGALFVVETDTVSARNRLWHLRKGVDGPSVAFTGALGYGRSGTLVEQ